MEQLLLLSWISSIPTGAPKRRADRAWSPDWTSISCNVRPSSSGFPAEARGDASVGKETGGKQNQHGAQRCGCGCHNQWYQFGVGKFTTHFRTYFRWDWDVHWGNIG